MDKLGSLILPTNEVTNVGGLYLGGYKASINRQFLEGQHITHVLNTAPGLVNFFGPKYEVRTLGFLYQILALMMRLKIMQNIGWSYTVKNTTVVVKVVNCTGTSWNLPTTCN